MESLKKKTIVATTLELSRMNFLNACHCDGGSTVKGLIYKRVVKPNSHLFTLNERTSRVIHSQ